jgi:hypothetical protein
VIDSQAFQVIENTDESITRKSKTNVKIDTSYFETKTQKSFIVKSNRMDTSTDNTFDPLGSSFDVRDTSMRMSKRHGTSFLSKPKTDPKKAKIKSYQALLKNESKKIQGAYEKKKMS